VADEAEEVPPVAQTRETIPDPVQEVILKGEANAPEGPAPLLDVIQEAILGAQTEAPAPIPDVMPPAILGAETETPASIPDLIHDVILDAEPETVIPDVIHEAILDAESEATAAGELPPINDVMQEAILDAETDRRARLPDVIHEAILDAESDATATGKPPPIPDIIPEAILDAEATASAEPAAVNDVVKEVIVGTDTDAPAVSEEPPADEEGFVVGDSEASEPPIFDKTQLEEELPVATDSTAGAPPPSLPTLPPAGDPLSPRSAELDSMLARMMKRHVLPAAEVRVDVINFARKQSAKLMLAQEYDEAAEIDMAIDIMFMSIEQDLRAQNSEQQTAVLRERLTECNATGQRVADEWNEIIDNVRQRTAVKLERLRQCHQEQLDGFESEWSAPEAKIPYSKPSHELLQIRQKQKAYALLHDFPNAKAMKVMAEAREKSEAADGAKRFTSAVRIAHAQLLERQQREVECLVQNAESVINLYEIDKQKWLSSVGLTRKSLELRITSPKIMKRPSVQLPILASRPSSVSSTATPSVPTAGMITHRTRDQLAVYRKSPEKRRLELKPAEVLSILRPSPRRPSRAESVEPSG
jgi:hypothetical protein